MAMSKEVFTMETSSDSEKDSVCAPCLDVGDHRQAVKFCIDCGHLVCHNCVDYHRRFKQMKEHKLVDISAAEDLRLSQKLAELLICPNHPDKTVELICKNHSVLCCLTCATVSHRGCQNVVELAKEALDLEQSVSVDELKNHLTAAKDHMTSILKEHEKCKKECIASSDEQIPKQLQELKEKVLQAFASMEVTIVTEKTKQRESIVRKHTVEQIKWVKKMESISEAISLLSTVQQNGSPIHKYVVANKLQKLIKDMDAVIVNQGKKLQTKAITLEVGTELTSLLANKPSRLADICVREVASPLQKYEYCPKIAENRAAIQAVAKCPRCSYVCYNESTPFSQRAKWGWQPRACSFCGFHF